MRVVTLNTWKCDGHYEERIRQLVAALPTVGADILMLQEVFDAPAMQMSTHDAVAAVLLEPGYQGVYCRARKKTRWVNGQATPSFSGLSVFVRGRVISSSAEPLSGSPEDPERVAQWLRVRLASMDLVIVTTIF